MNKKWINRFGFLVIILFSILVLTIVSAFIADMFKNATNMIINDFIYNTQGGYENGIQELYNALQNV